MIRTFVAVVLVACVARAQSKSSIPDSLDAALAVAMQSHPDVLLAEAKLRQAEAEVMQARLKATREVVELWNGRRVIEAEQQSAMRALMRSRELHGQGKIDQSALDALEERVNKAEVALSGSEAALKGLTGLMGGTTNTALVNPWLRLQTTSLGRLALGSFVVGAGSNPPGGTPVVAAVEYSPAGRKRPELPADLGRQLDANISVQLEEVSIPEAVKHVLKGVSVNLVVDPNDKDHLESSMVSVSLKDVSVRAALGAIFDQTEFALVHREYGFRLTNANRAMQMLSPAIPGSIPLDESPTSPDAVVRKRPDLPADLAQRLDATISVQLGEVSIPDAVKQVLKGVPVNLVIDPNDKDNLGSAMVSIALKDVSVRAALVAILDQTEFALVHREYGFRLTNANRAMQMISPSIPDSIPLDG